MKKIVIIVNDYTDHINFELFCFEYDFFKVKLVERCFFNLTDENVLSLKQELITKLAELEFNKASCVVGINSPFFFSETLTMPKLNFLEEGKAITLKLDKLYKNFDENYHSVRDKYVYNKTTKRHYVVAVKKQIYARIIDKFEKLALNIDKVVFLPKAMASYIGKKHIFPADKVGMFINLDRTTSSILIVKGTHLIDYKLFDTGVMTLYETLTGKKATEIEDIENKKEKLEIKAQTEYVREFINNFVYEIKSMSYLHDVTVNEFFLQSEYGIDKALKGLFENALGIKFKTSSKPVSSSNYGIQAISVLKILTTDFPVKTKWLKQTKVLL